MQNSFCKFNGAINNEEAHEEVAAREQRERIKIEEVCTAAVHTVQPAFAAGSSARVRKNLCPHCSSRFPLGLLHGCIFRVRRPLSLPVLCHIPRKCTQFRFSPSRFCLLFTPQNSLSLSRSSSRLNTPHSATCHAYLTSLTAHTDARTPIKKKSKPLKGTDGFSQHNLSLKDICIPHQI